MKNILIIILTILLLPLKTNAGTINGTIKNIKAWYGKNIEVTVQLKQEFGEKSTDLKIIVQCENRTKGETNYKLQLSEETTTVHISNTSMNECKKPSIQIQTEKPAPPRPHK